MFTGLFVGPTSQAPRVDEARHDALYELEIALPHLTTDTPAWAGRRAAPPSGSSDSRGASTHRAEISIDKLYDPHAPYVPPGHR